MFEHVRAIAFHDDARATGRADVAAGLPMLADHFPGRALLPGTWLVELAAQIAGPLVERTSERWALLAMIEHAKFYAPVELPAALVIDAACTRREPATATTTVTVRRDDAIVMRATLVFTLVDPGLAPEAAVVARRARLARWTATDGAG